MADVFVAMLPAPPAGLNPNRRLNRFRLAELRQAYRDDVCAAILHQYPRHSWPRLQRARGDVTFWFPDRRRRDLDNLFAALKSGIDVLVRLGVIADDGPAQIDEWRLHYRVDRESDARVLLMLYGRPATTGEVSG